jgi:hypothetical protein
MGLTKAGIGNMRKAYKYIGENYWEGPGIA